MLSGLPINQQNTTGQQIGYQAGPNQSSQIAGLGTAALGGLGLLNQSGALSGIKSMFNTPGGGGSNTYMPGGGGAPNTYIPNADLTMDNRDVGDFGGSENNFVTTGEDWAKGGYIRSYAKGGLVTLALHNALKGVV